MNNNIYTQYQNSGLSVSDFISLKAMEWGIDASVIEAALIPDMQRHRSLLYPDIRDQLDAIWHDIDCGKLDRSGIFYSMISGVKAANKKPE